MYLKYACKWSFSTKERSGVLCVSETAMFNKWRHGCLVEWPLTYTAHTKMRGMANAKFSNVRKILLLLLLMIVVVFVVMMAYKIRNDWKIFGGCLTATAATISSRRMPMTSTPACDSRKGSCDEARVWNARIGSSTRWWKSSKVPSPEPPRKIFYSDDHTRTKLQEGGVASARKGE